jgi:D-sedoheptulose 7-phosphate isomerase
MALDPKTNHKEKNIIIETLWESSRTLRNLARDSATIQEIGDVLVKAYRNGKKMVLFGNGGSAADAQHIAAEMVSSFVSRERRSLPALALTTNTSLLTAVGNDFDFERVFARQVESMVEKGDVVIAISTSGNSPNVLEGAKAARKRKATVIGFTGQDGGKLAPLSDVCLKVPSKVTAHIQEAHIATAHLLCGMIESALCGRGK